ncbi:TetR/AcrR family transcriptional regulator [Pseudonocardiaceae bacterium YIM PH 21723]|nr:TetR/AcrR family transcriptional regulator [Pseudonocardiaceae bacterium YIM PH 21723]
MTQGTRSARPAADEEIRERILDAAQDVMLSAGITARVHAQIAERAGLSRPTVYKYVGDQDAIMAALLERETNRFFDAVTPQLERDIPVRERFVDLITFAVTYAREHALLQFGLQQEPEKVLPWLTIYAAPIMQLALSHFEPLILRLIEEKELPEVDSSLLIEIIVRLILSLLSTPGLNPSQSREDLKANIDMLFHVVGHIVNRSD